jgi:DNA-binding Lrp family transcriptional regulator
MATTEQWECKNHDEIKYNKADAVDSNFKCTIIENSKCPECQSLLKIKRLSSGQYYFDCPKCHWNSYLRTPGLFFPSKAQLENEAKKYELISGNLKECNKKLKYITGKQICPKCFLDLLKRGTATNFSTIIDTFNITAEQMIKLTNRFMEEGQIYGIIDQKSRVFYYISSEMREKLISKIQNEGLINVTDLGVMLDMSSEMALQVIYKLISQFQVRGSFSQDKKNYFTQTYINNTLVKDINSKGRALLEDLSEKLKIPQELIKNFCVNLMRMKLVDAFFADRGKEIITVNQLYAEIKKYAKEVGVFKISNLAETQKIAEELARKTLHEMIKQGDINGVFTQRREFMTNIYLETKVKELAKAYRNMPLREISNRLGVTEASVEENLARLIGIGEIDGYIDSQKKLLVAYSVPLENKKEISSSTKITEQKGDDQIEVVRDYDFEGGQLHFKVVVRNNSDMAINNVKVVLDVPTSYNVKQPLITIPVIEAKNSRGVDFYLEPKECGISSIGGTVIYKKANGEQNTIHIQKKEAQIKCPLVCTSLLTIDDCQLAIQDLPNDARAFLIADLDPRLAYRAAIRALKYFETSMVTSYEGGNDVNSYEAEAWFCAEAKVTGGRIITRVYVSAVNQSLEVRVWCANPGQLTGFLARIIELLMEEINVIRKIKSEEREKTIDVMAITQNLAEVSDYCMLKWKAQNIRNKLHDTFLRLRKILKDDNAVLGRIEFWLTQLNKYEKEDNISDEDADKLVNDVEMFKNVLQRTLKI